MDARYLALLAGYLALLAAIAVPLGRYLAWCLQHSSGAGRGGLGERLLYRAAGVSPQAGMNARQYAMAVLAFNLAGALAVYALQRLQGWLPLNPAGLGAVPADSAFNTAVSFATNTNWQGYAGETTMSHLTQMLGLGVQNFLSAATGIAVAFAVMRGLTRQGDGTLGNFWRDLLRITLYVLLPLSLLLALALVAAGTIQNLSPSVIAHGLEGGAQTLPMGPVASQEAIKLLGTNGGGFFNANSAHPFENPSALSNLLQMLAILAIPAALCVSFGHLAGQRRQGYALLGAMTLLFVGCALAAGHLEHPLTPALAQAGVLPDGGNMEGKEVRFGIGATALYAVITTAASCGAVNGMMDSFSALGGMVPMLLMQLGEVVYGGVGSGLYGMLAFALLTVFVCGLMIGRTPEYLGKKLEPRDMKMVAIALLVTPLLVLGGTAVAVLADAGRAGMLNPGPHGYSEVLYALSSAANNNGSAFAGLSANTPFYNVLLAVAMWLGRYLPIVALLALAGSLAVKPRLDAGPGALPTGGPMFALLLAGCMLLVGALTYVPALALGPIAEFLQP
ncbi:potassium-transporting ATPase subunit KdpA [Bordetella sp. 2513F-2]